MFVDPTGENPAAVALPAVALPAAAPSAGAAAGGAAAGAGTAGGAVAVGSVAAAGVAGYAVGTVANRMNAINSTRVYRMPKIELQHSASAALECLPRSWSCDTTRGLSLQRREQYEMRSAGRVVT